MPDAVERFKELLKGDLELQPYQRDIASRVLGLDVEVHQDPTDPDGVLVFNSRALRPHLSLSAMPLISVPDGEPYDFRRLWLDEVRRMPWKPLIIWDDGPTYIPPRPVDWQDYWDGMP